jgi:DNA-binding transcriptional ArsR family regulator
LPANRRTRLCAGARQPEDVAGVRLALTYAEVPQFAPRKTAKRLAHHISLCLSVAMESDIFKALADPTRRSVFEKLAVGKMNASDLRRGMAISQPAMSQHLAVLRSAGLVRERRDGRFVNYEVDPQGLVRIGQWLARYRAYWPRRIDDLKALLKDMDQ